MECAAAALVALALVALWPRAQPATTTAEARFEIVTPATTDPGSIALSPDGQHIAFVATSDGEPMLWVRSLATGDARALKGTDRATLPFWSPDGRSIAFFGDRTLRRVNLQGTTIVDVAPAPVGTGGTWHREGGILYADTATGRIVTSSFPSPAREGRRGRGANKDLIAMLSKWRHSGFQVFCGQRIFPRDETAMENLARYIIRASFSQERTNYLAEPSKVV